MKTAVVTILAFVAGALVSGAATFRYARGGSPDTTASIASATAQVDSNSPAPQRVDHWYSMEGDGMYGYEPMLSENDRAAGVVASSLIMARFIDVRDGVFQVWISSAGIDQLLECQLPCSYVKVRRRSSHQFIDAAYHKTENGSVLYGIMADALAGKLRRYVRSKDGRREVFKVAENGFISREPAPTDVSP